MLRFRLVYIPAHGYVYDEETGLYYLQSRYYDPEVGRFLNADAFTSTGQGLLGNNMFAYCLNSPVTCADSSGTRCIPVHAYMGGETDSNYKKYGAARDYVYTDSTEYRCFPYALGMDEACYIEDAPLSSITIEEARDMTLAKVKAEGMKIRLIDSYDSPIAYNEYRIALRVSERDYHFMVQHSDGTWSHKPGELPSRRIDGDNPSAVSWDIPNVIGIEYTDDGGYRYIENGVIENVYTSEIVYFAISE